MGNNIIEVVIQAKNNAGAALKDAESQLSRLSGGVSNINPAVGGAITQINNLSGSFGKLGSGAAAWIGVGAIAGAAIVGVGMAAFNAGKQIADQVEQLDRLSNRTGVSVDNLQVMREVLKESGGNAEGLGQSLSFLNRSIANQDPLLVTLGITTTDTYDAFMQLAKALSQSDNAAAKSAITMKLLGRGGSELLGDIDALANGTDTMRAAMERAGLLMSGDVLDGARRLDTQMDALSRNWDGAITRMKTATIGPVEKMTEAFNALFDAMNHVKSGPEATAAKAANKLDARLQMLEQMKGDVEGRVDWGKGASKGELDDIGKLNRAIDSTRASIAALRHEAGQLPDTVFGGGTTTDPLAHVKFGGDTEDAGKERQKQIDLYAKSLNMSKADAAELYEQLKQLETLKLDDTVTKQLNELQIRLDKLRGSPATDNGAPQNYGEAPGVAIPKAPEGHYGSVTQMQNAKGMKGAEDSPTQKVLKQWREFVAEVTSGASILNESLGVLQGGLASGFDTVFTKLIEGANMTKLQFLDVFGSMIAEVIRMLSQLASMALLKFVMGFFTGGAAMTTLGGGVIDWLNPMKTANSVAPAITTNAIAPGITTNHITIQTFSPRDVMLQYTSPSGVLRTAQTRMTLSGAY